MKEFLSQSLLERVVSYIEGNLEDELRIGVITEMVQVSESTLLRLFRQRFGQTPREFMRTRRLEKAQHLLFSGQHSVLEVAILVGYTNHSGFTRAFQKHFGKPPSHFLP